MSSGAAKAVVPGQNTFCSKGAFPTHPVTKAYFDKVESSSPQAIQEYSSTLDLESVLVKCHPKRENTLRSEFKMLIVTGNISII